jgi:hypothetical protein
VTINIKNLIAVFIFSLISLAISSNAFASVQNSVSATANTGGNTISGGGTIKTGDASSSVKSETNVSGENNVQNKTDAKAEAQGNGATASVNVNGDKKSCAAENGQGCQVQIQNSTQESQGNQGNQINQEDGGNNINTADISDKASKPKDKNIAEKIVGAVESFAKNIINGIKGWL